MYQNFLTFEIIKEYRIEVFISYVGAFILD